MTIRRRPAMFVVLTAAAGSVMLALALPNVGPAVRAARGDGVHGTFVAERLSCVQHPGHELCSWYGTFHPDPIDRAASSPGATATATTSTAATSTAATAPGVRTDIALYGSDRGTLRSGQRIPAVDTGRPARVYPPDGSREWIAVAALLTVGCLLCVPLGLAAATAFRSAGLRRRARVQAPVERRAAR
jgi:hypothetical protein